MSREPQDDEVDYEAYLYRRPSKRNYEHDMMPEAEGGEENEY